MGADQWVQITSVVAVLMVFYCVDRARRKPQVKDRAFKKPREASQCPQGHALVSFYTAVKQCSRCRQDQHSARMDGCLACKYQLCTACQGSEIKLLDTTSKEYKEIAKYFKDKWKPQETWGKSFCAPNIARIYQLDFWAHRPDYAHCQQAWRHKSRWKPHNGAGNEQRRFHGTRLQCSFVSDVPCMSSACSTCCILRARKFSLALRGSASSPGVYGDGLYFTACSHTAKGYGLKDPGDRPPGSANFAKHDAGNAIFVVNVLAGNAELVKGVAYNQASPPAPMPAPDPAEFDSRVVIKSTGNDELVVFDEKQALPRYLILFGP